MTRGGDPVVDQLFSSIPCRPEASAPASAEFCDLMILFSISFLVSGEKWLRREGGAKRTQAEITV